MNVEACKVPSVLIGNDGRLIEPPELPGDDAVWRSAMAEFEAEIEEAGGNDATYMFVRL